MLPTIERLRVIARLCVTGEPLGRDLAHWLGDSLQGFLSHRHHSLDAALGLRWAKGGVPWWLEEAIRKRDLALRELASRFLDGLSIAAQAKRIRALSLRYAASAWRHERDCTKPPPEIGGTPKEWLWRAFKSGAAMPLGERQLRKILVRSSPWLALQRLGTSTPPSLGASDGIGVRRDGTGPATPMSAAPRRWDPEDREGTPCGCADRGSRRRGRGILSAPRV